MDYFKIRTFSLLGQRGTFGTVLNELATQNEKILAITADLTRTSGLEDFSASHPERFYNVGIAEENAIGMAAGLADQGYIPFVSTFANFATLRANEFVRHFMAYMNCNVKLVGLGSGFAMELFGTTHYGVEDIATIRSMPNIMIFSPADGLEVAKIVEYATKTKGPMYIRLSGKMNNPMVHKQDFEFVPIKMMQVSNSVTEGASESVSVVSGTVAEGNNDNDVVIYATGSMVSIALKAANKLKENGINVSVYDVHTIKPFDTETVVANKNKKLIITVEEHSMIGGLGSAVAEVLSSQEQHGKLIRLGTRQEYKPAGSYDYMLKEHRLTVDEIIKIATIL